MIPTMQQTFGVRSGSGPIRTTPNKYLIDSGVTKISKAIKEGDYQLVEQLVPEDSRFPPEYLERALCIAITENQLQIGRLLLMRGAVFDKHVIPSRPDA